MGKNAYERRLIRLAKLEAKERQPRSVEWHEQNVIKQARKFAQVYVTTVGFGRPLARAGAMLNEAVERLEAATEAEKLRKKLESAPPPVKQGRQGLGEIPAATLTVGERREAGEADSGGADLTEEEVELLHRIITR